MNSLAEQYRDWTRLIEQAQQAMDAMRGQRVRYAPFGRRTNFIGKITGFRASGVMVAWDDAAHFWDGTKPHPINPDDLVTP